MTAFKEREKEKRGKGRVGGERKGVRRGEGQWADSLGPGGEWKSRLEKCRTGVIGKSLEWWVKNFGFHVIFKNVILLF